MSIKLIVGLRNPGSNYAGTRHNAGGWFVEALGLQHHLSFKSDKKINGELAVMNLGDNSCYLLLPHTFMNVSGTPVRVLAQFYRILPEEILVAHDDLDLPVGVVRLKKGGGHGGHNGLRDIIEHLGTKDFNRLRIGIGHPGHKDLVHDFVLGKPSMHDKQLIIDGIESAIDIMPKLFTDIAAAMNILHRGL